MQIATGILAIILSFIVMFQSCAVSVSGHMSGSNGASEGGALGIIVALLIMIGGAFAFKLPKVAMYVFGAATLLALLTGSAAFTDMQFWAVVSGIFTGMSYYANKKNAQNVTPPVK